MLQHSFPAKLLTQTNRAHTGKTLSFAFAIRAHDLSPSIRGREAPQLPMNASRPASVQARKPSEGRVLFFRDARKQHLPHGLNDPGP